MKYQRTGVSRFHQGLKLYQLEDGHWVDEFNTRYFIASCGKLYRELPPWITEKGRWCWMRPDQAALAPIPKPLGKLIGEPDELFRRAERRGF